MTRAFGAAAGFILIVGEPALELNCSATEIVIPPSEPSMCFRSPCQSWLDALPLHTDSDSEGEYPSTVVTYSASGSGSNVTANISSFSYQPNLAPQPEIQIQEAPATIPSVSARANPSRPHFRGDFFGSTFRNSRNQSVPANTKRLGALSTFQQRGFVRHQRG